MKLTVKRQSKTNDDFNTLIECDVMNINISSLTNVSAAAAGKAPYYLSAFESGGLVTTTELYMDSQWLRWQVNHKAGSELVLSMFDAEGNSGGVLDTIFTVAGMSNSSCLAPSPAPLSPPTIVPNITDTLGTCQTWGLYVSGGSPPYTISMVVAGSTAITNYTVPQGVGLFSYINTSLPDKRVLGGRPFSDSADCESCPNVVFRSVPPR
ncbi:hypothetical protein SERLADRAFT_350011 [Serpula lacrymans var. lacrymans S7.9]|uniref:Uncharacterized protein n=1 Tax=Serpula lacrymans var. lacrymans (strain S7.9) TaxID=578457 RepID=F8P1P2_SERL9|nr:uncharacterized protein SERLADRAFT_350011 [Serpula lacrymans var. lacrymans S7.9]EGO23071.1 hypothetical protein SERLADRAFT_350011 [Serpula lacrymans var. lacrymans S7.9]